MKAKKLFLSGCTLLAATILLGACGSKEKADTSSSSSEKTAETSSSQSATEVSQAADVDLPQLSSEVTADEDVIVMETTMGNIKIKLFPKYAPKAVENFMTHAKDGYYNGLIFHRVINDFMIQGGDPLGTGTGGESIWGSPFEDEFSENLRNFRGALSMANSGSNTNGSQFFIVQAKTVDATLLEQMKTAGWSQNVIDAYKENGGTPWLDNQHTVFGQVIEGMDVVDAIAAADADSSTNKPKEDIKINKIEIIQEATE